jgi:cephalosporin hydroxylase
MEFTFQQSGTEVVLNDQIVEWTTTYASSMLDANELLHLAAALAACPSDNGGFVVEIGAYLGTTTVFMAKVLENLGKPVPILSIDPFERYEPNPLNPQGNYSAYISNIIANHVDTVCLPLATFSATAASVVASGISLLVIDGDHHYPSVIADLRLYTANVREGGYIFIDDYGPSYPDVIRAVDEFFTDNPEFLIHAKSDFVVAQRYAGTNKRNLLQRVLGL